jgi:ribosome-associated translation inhibitor RaiA
MYFHCTAYAKKKYKLRTDISSNQPADNKHALDFVVMVTGPSLLKKTTDTEIYVLFNEVMNKLVRLATS